MSPGGGAAKKLDVPSALDRVRSLTMVPRESLVDLAYQVQVVLARNIPGAFVECGVWCGGASFLMADLLRQAGVRDRKVWLFDSFEGMPPPQPIDGPAALAWAQSPEKPWYSERVPFSLDKVRQNASRLGVDSHTEFVKGWFDRTLPASRAAVVPIALLRIDADWYSSVQCCLENLYDQVAEGGFVVLDDYYAYDGCAIAVHEFLARRRLPHRIESGTTGAGEPGYYQGVVLRKGSETWKWARQVHLAFEEVAALVPAGRPFILVDEDQIRSAAPADHRAFPYLEKDGQYWGPPPEDDTAIRELERLRQSGAELIVFAWPAFWWLDHYSRFHHYLRTNFRCVLQNERVVVFDLRSR
ncbi:MAG TPA: TylF/MycF/NovP-related O-methyltransferase [Gemmataceae bacterium]|nr:TylF/MycF/NovP-related O-methyltransferase [Gemmataceae bacterium]